MLTYPLSPKGSPMKRILAVVAAAAALAVVPATAHAQTTCTKYVALTGNDTTGDGSATAPWRTVLKGVNSVPAGTTLCLRAGTYVEEVVDSSVPDGTVTAPITLKSEDVANKAVIDGRFSLSGLSYWRIKELKFTNPTPVATDIVNARIVSLIGGDHVMFMWNEVYSGTYAGLLVGRASPTSTEWPTDYNINNNYIHDTTAANLYFNPGRPSTGNIIERNRFARSGTENLKVGWGDHCDGITPTGTDGYGAGGTIVRYNTMYDAGTGGNYITAEPGGLQDVRVYRNMLVDPASQRGYSVRYDSATNSTTWPNGCLGDKVYVTDNWAYATSPSTGAPLTLFSEDYDDSAVNQGHESGNVVGQDPQLGTNFVPQNTTAKAYGHAAP